MEVSFDLVDGKCVGTFVIDKDHKDVLVREVKESDRGPHFKAIEDFEAAHSLKLSFDEKGVPALEVLPPPIAEVVPEEIANIVVDEPFAPTPIVESVEEKKEEE